MCYIQLSILGYAGYVAIGNSLTNPLGGTELFPTIGEGRRAVVHAEVVFPDLATASAEGARKGD